MVTAVAVVNFILGGLNALCGGLLLLSGGVVAGVGAARAAGGGAEGAAAATVIGGLLVVLGVVSLILSIPTIVAGVGVLKRRQWGRVLTLILGGLSGLIGLSLLIRMQAGGLLQLAYCVFVYVVLLNSKYAAEFD